MAQKTSLLYLLVLILLPASSLAAAWPLKKGDVQVINTLLSYRSQYFIDDNGRRHRQGTFSKFDYNPYIEYGLSKKNTVGISPHFVYASQRTQSEAAALTDVEIFLRRYKKKDHGLTLSSQYLIKLPGGYGSGKESLLGTNGFDIEKRLLVGYNFSAYKKQHFANAELAYRYRNGVISDEIRLDTTLGLRFSEKWSWLIQEFGTFAIQPSIAEAGATPANNTGYRLVKLQNSALYDLTEKLALQFGVTQDVYSRNTGRGMGIIAGVWVRF